MVQLTGTDGATEAGRKHVEVGCILSNKPCVSVFGNNCSIQVMAFQDRLDGRPLHKHVAPPIEAVFDEKMSTSFLFFTYKQEFVPLKFRSRFAFFQPAFSGDVGGNQNFHSLFSEQKKEAIFV